MTSTTSYGTLSPITPLRVPAIIWKNIIWHGRFLSAMDALVCNHYGILYFGCVTWWEANHIWVNNDDINEEEMSIPER